MGLGGLDVVTFLGFLAVVVGVSLYASREEESAEDYFLAGRSLRWPLIGISLVASNISTEHFVGMAGKGYEIGLAIASFEWIAVIALVAVALVLLPRFLRAGIYTLPEYLEYRYNAAARAVMAFYLMVMYVVAAMAGVLYTGSLALSSLFGVDLYVGVWAIGLLAGAYTTEASRPSCGPTSSRVWRCWRAVFS
jgi:SSS family solute:Na+ symporter